MIAFRPLILIVLALLPWTSTLYACAEAHRIPLSGPAVASFVPPEFEIANRAEADFNGDGLGDSLIVMNSKEEKECRPLLVLFKMTDGTFELSARADGIMAGSGGVHSGPFGEIEVRQNTFVVTQFTGSTQVQNSSHSQFQFREGGWYLIGNKLTANMPQGSDEWAGLNADAGEFITGYSVDKNLLNGNQQETWAIFNTTTGKERTVVKRKKHKVAPLVRLEDFTDASAY